MKHLLLTTIAAVLLEGTAFADPIHDAAKNGNLALVQAGLEKGVDVNLKDAKSMQETPLHFAAEHGHTELCQFLLDNGARPSLTVRYRGKTPKVWAELGGHSECAAIL